MDGTGTRYTSPSTALSVEENLTFKRKGGCFVSTKAAAFLIFIIVLLLIVTAILTRHITQREYESATADSNDTRTSAVEIRRLSGDVVPIHYKVMLEPYLTIATQGKERFRLFGHVRIVLETKQALSSIEIHGVGFKITDEEIKLVILEDTDQSNTWSKLTDSELPASSSVHIQSVTENATSETYTITLGRQIDGNRKYLLAIHYTAPIKESSVGIYASKYTDRTGKERWIVESNFKPTYARRAFPSFDEPIYKATYDVSILRLGNMSSLSNAKKKKSEISENGWVWDHYETTPPMSSYLLGVVVFDFTSTRDFNYTKTEVDSWTRQEALANINYQSPSVASHLAYYSDHLGFQYELPKLDLVALPNLPYLEAENWGLIKIREMILLLKYSTPEKVLTFSRAIAQQWFGNLVSVKWWSDSWLMEGLANYYQYLSASTMSDSIMDFFVTNELQHALMEDSLNHSKALTGESINTTDIFNYYDETSSKKGAALISMLHKTLGSTIFDNGMKQFINKWNHKNVEANDFWSSFTIALQNESAVNMIHDLDVIEIMNSWTSQAGYPVLNVNYDPGNGDIHLRQKKFSLINSTSTDLWYLPVSYITKLDPNEDDAKKLWLKKSPEATVHLKEKNDDNWVLFHLSYPGFYRINYDERNWKLLIDDFMGNNNFVNNTSSRAQIIDDSFQLARAGLLNYSIPLNMSKHLITKEREFLPWYTALQNIKFLQLFFWNSPHYPVFQNYIEKLIGPLYRESLAQFQKEPSVLQTSILNLACDYEVNHCINLVKDLYTAWISKNTEIPIFIKATVYCQVVRYGGKKEIDSFWNMYRNITLDPVERTMILKGLTCSSTPWAINMLLNETLKGELSWEDIKTLWLQFSKKPIAVATLLEFVKNNWETISIKFENNSHIMKGILRHFTSTLTTDDHLNELLDMKKQITIESWKWQLEKAIEIVQHNVNWRTIHMPYVTSWLHKFKREYAWTL